MKKIKYIIIIIIVIFAAKTIYTYAKPAEQSQTSETITLVNAQKGDIKKTVSCTGKIVSNLDVVIKCKASGEIIKLPVDLSDAVKENDLICELDPEDEKRSLRQARVKLQSSKAKLAQAKVQYKRQKEMLDNKIAQKKNEIKTAKADLKDCKRDYARLKRLYKKQNTSLESLENAELAALKAENSLQIKEADLSDLESQKNALSVYENNIVLSECDVESNQIALETAEERLKETKVFAPSDGVISALNVQKGLIVSSPTSNVSGGTTLMTISDLSRLFVLADVDESDIGQIRLAQPVEIAVDAYQKEKFKGEVVRIATQGTTASSVVTFEVKIEITSKNKKLLLPEMTTDIEIITDQAENTIYIPETALVTKKGKSFVYVYDKALAENRDKNRNEKIAVKGSDEASKRKGLNKKRGNRKGTNIPGQRRMVETGLSDGINIEILSGLSADEQIIDTPLKSNQKWVKEKKSLFSLPGPQGARRAARRVSRGRG